MDFQTVEQNLRNSYRQITSQYRKDDEIEVTTANHEHLHGILNALSTSFGRPIAVLDVGCGTGRYFHCLKNVRQLVGVDLSPDMLAAAEHPVREEEAYADTIQLICGNAFRTTFANESFDLIYSLGMFGNGCPVTPEICDRFYDWLAPGGRLFFNTVDVAGFPWPMRLRKNLRRIIYPCLPQRFQKTLDERENRMPLFGLSRSGLEAIMRASRFTEFTVSSHVCQSPLWKGIHLECQARKAG